MRLASRVNLRQQTGVNRGDYHIYLGLTHHLLKLNQLFTLVVYSIVF